MPKEGTIVAILLIVAATLVDRVHPAHHEPKPLRPQGLNLLKIPQPQQQDNPPIRGRPPTQSQPSPSNTMMMPPPRQQRPPQTQSTPNGRPPPMNNNVNNNRMCMRVPGPVSNFGGKRYWFSWESNNRNNMAQRSWSDAFRTCEDFCMKLSAIETPGEDNFIGQKVARSDVYGLWIGARKCDEAGCQQPTGSPWVWKGTRRLLDRPDRYSNWSQGGAHDHGSHGSLSQPDNFTGNEQCAAILNDWFNDGSKWHDMECQDRLPFVCES